MQSGVAASCRIAEKVRRSRRIDCLFLCAFWPPGRVRNVAAPRFGGIEPLDPVDLGDRDPAPGAWRPFEREGIAARRRRVEIAGPHADPSRIDAVAAERLRADPRVRGVAVADALPRQDHRHRRTAIEGETSWLTVEGRPGAQAPKWRR